MNTLATVGKAVGPALAVGGGAFSAYALYGDIQRGDVAAGVGDTAGVLSSGATLAGTVAGSAALTTAGSVVGAFGVGYAVGTILNKTAIEPIVDRFAPGSGPMGEWYYRTFLK